MSIVDIYLLYHKDNKEINYVGSTERWNRRFGQHHFILRFNYKNIIIEYIDSKNCETKEDRDIYEQSWINKIKPNYNVINPHTLTAIKYEKKNFDIPIVKDENEIIVYPNNLYKYSGCVSKDSNMYRVIFNKNNFKYSKYFKNKEDADKHCIEISKKQGFVKNLLYLKFDEKTKEEYYEMELQRKDLRTKIDIDCFELVDKHIYSHDKGYIYHTEKINGKKIRICLHNELCETKENESVDHENRDSLDNRKSNLKSKNKSEQNTNRNLLKNNTSGVTGVHYCESKKSWICSYYTAPKKRILKHFNINLYKNKQNAYIEACICRHNAEMTLPYYKNALGIKQKYEIIIEE